MALISIFRPYFFNFFLNTEDHVGCKNKAYGAKEHIQETSNPVQKLILVAIKAVNFAP